MMPDLSDIYATKFGAVTYAEPMSDTPLADVVRTNERNTRLTENMVSETAAREEAYDNRIRAIKTATGIELENPERGGYSIDARKAIRQAVIAGDMSPIDETGGIPTYQKRIFDQKVAELQVKHPDLTDTITGSIDEQGRGLAAESSRDLARAMDQPINPFLKYGAAFAGGMWGSRRDPIFLGSLFAGPVTATGRTAFARVARSALNQGLFNAGITAVEQPAVQAWHAKIGQETGVKPFIEDVGMAFLLGTIPGAAITGLHEAATPLRRLLAGRPEAGDFGKVKKILQPTEPASISAPEEVSIQERTVRAGEDSLAADRAVLTEPAPMDVGGLLGARGEKVANAAVRFRDEVFPGSVHYTALESAAKRFGISIEEAIAELHNGKNDNDLFITSLGRLVGREEARTIADHADQLLAFAKKENKPRLSMEEIKPEERGGIPEDLHHDLMGAALKRADDPSAPSPEAVAVVRPPTKPTVSDRDPNQFLQEMAEKYGEDTDLAKWSDADRAEYNRRIDESAQKVTLEKQPLPADLAADEAMAASTKFYDIMRGGEKVGEARFAGYGLPENETALMWVGREPEERAKDFAAVKNTLGPKAMREAMNAFIKENPQITKIHADRISGARGDHEHLTFSVKNGRLILDRGAEAVATELQDRIEQAAPRNEREAHAAADEALDDFGRRDGMAELAERMRAAREAQDETTAAWQSDETRERPDAEHIRSMVPMLDRNNNVVMRSERAVRSDGDVEMLKAELIRSCK